MQRRPSAALPCSHSPSGSAGWGSSSGWCSRSPRAWCNHTKSHACCRWPRPCLYKKKRKKKYTCDRQTSDITICMVNTTITKARVHQYKCSGKKSELVNIRWQIHGKPLMKSVTFQTGACRRQHRPPVLVKSLCLCFVHKGAPVKTSWYFEMRLQIYEGCTPSTLPLSVCIAALNTYVLADGTDSHFNATPLLVNPSH